MKKYLLIVCAVTFLFTINGNAQKFYEIKFSYGGTEYDVLEIVTKTNITFRTAFSLDSDKYVLSSEYKNYTGKMDNGNNYSLLVSASAPVSLTRNRRQPNLVPCYFYSSWKDGENMNKATLYWKPDHHTLRDPESEKYRFSGKEVSYFKKLKKDEITDEFLERFMYRVDNKVQTPVIVQQPSRPPVENKPEPPAEKDNDDDIVYIQEAQYALSQKNKDYDAAITSLKKVSPAGQKHRLFAYYAAIAYEGAGNYELALANYKKYLNFSPNNTEIINKIAEIAYKLDKINPTGTWKDIKSSSGKIFAVQLTGNTLTIRSADKKVDMTLGYTSANGDGAKRYDGHYKVPLVRKFREGSCTLCGYNDGIKAYCEINATNSNIQIYVKDVNVSLETEQVLPGKTTYKPCCKAEPLTDYDFLYELERN